MTQIAKDIQTQVIILARGKGERLRPFTLIRPKPFCPVCNESMLTRVLNQVISNGFPGATISLPSVLPPEWADIEEAARGRIEVTPELAKQNASGSFSAAKQCVDTTSHRVLVIYGDSLLRADLRGLVQRHRVFAEERGALATVLYHLPSDRFTQGADGRTYHGIMSCTPEGRVRRFEEKPLVESLHKGFDLANAAVFVVETSVFFDARFAGAADFSRDFFEPAVNGGKAKIYACPIGKSGYRFDLGDPGRLLEANLRILRREWAGHIPGREALPDTWIEDGATWKGASIQPPVSVARGAMLGENSLIGPGAIIGRDCFIGQRARIRNSVIMARATIEADAVIDSSVIGCDSFVASGAILRPGSYIGDFSRIG